ncbi:MAG TPA: orotidine-5'-phosphate decarboxylase [Methylomirabilota bacterium]|nr:orotidine-5'-phosphate decarboxylase [Methylomirabilota bacterium]
MKPAPEFAIAFDVATLEAAVALDTQLGPGPELAKIGLELFAAAGPEAVRALQARGRRVFLDLKLHDIPNTVKGAGAAVARLGADLLTVHATGGAAMVAAAVEGIRAAGGKTRVVAVTLLTSLDPAAMPPGFATPFDLHAVAAALIDQAEKAGALGVVCSPADLEGVRAKLGREFFAVTPGIRPAGADAHDQKRVATIESAVRDGASLLVLGRAITGASDPGAALAAARAQRDRALMTRASR